MPRNIDLFNEMVGLIFLELYESFPVEKRIDKKAIAEAMGGEVRYTPGYVDNQPEAQFSALDGDLDFDAFLLATLGWLAAEGFILLRPYRKERDARLTAKALTAISAPIDTLGGNLGTKLNAAVKGVGGEVGRSAIAETVGQIIGGVVKSMSG